MRDDYRMNHDRHKKFTSTYKEPEIIDVKQVARCGRAVRTAPKSTAAPKFSICMRHDDGMKHDNADSATYCATGKKFAMDVPFTSKAENPHFVLHSFET